MNDLNLDDVDLLSTPNGDLVTTHAATICKGHPCPFHQPSDHPMRDWEIVIGDNDEHLLLGVLNRGIGVEYAPVFRRCVHGDRHPDPDSLSYARYLGGKLLHDLAAHHHCDNCCGDSCSG